ncbi:chalcone isomerase family protein [Thioalkalivibrio sp. XN279]|uniref:chalcone isomerase family protein n=1 Tax=Thioalkalivibrio sp. XN279 TaxID=2714953 RepID=UPI00140DD075|nr:chalcone isomerase family protein [Thioalkalivibrio sp. XN279]NHA14941.1 hypothetical protein [Thioalkalivibrio sp. XN279]
MPPRFITAAAVLLSSLLAVPVQGAADLSGPLDALHEVGSGELTWFGLDVYEARLHSATPEFKGLDGSVPVALEITYRRNISSESLVKTTAKEWRRLRTELGLPAAERLQPWLDAVAEIWPDVTPGDRIIARVEPGGPTFFYGNDGLLGVVDDPDFGPAFLGIWLHPETRDASLRAALLGDTR